MTEFTDKTYNVIATKVYQLDPKENDKPLETGATFKSDGQVFQVIDAIGNSAEPTENGMQAMAVAPVDVDGNVDYSEVVIAYAGTNFGDMPDVMTDLQSLGLGSTETITPNFNLIAQMQQVETVINTDQIAIGLTASFVDAQPATAVAFADRVEELVRKENPNATITTTGHSLGEAIAIYTALKKSWNNVGFNGPDIGNMISPEELAYMLAHPNQFRNFRNPNDILGNCLGNKTGVAIYVDVDGSKMKSFTSYVLTKPNLLPESKWNLLYDYFNRNHALNTWIFKDGQVVDKDGNKIIAANYRSLQATVLEKTNGDLSKWAALDKSLSQGGYSANEEIYLDSLKARIVADGLGSSAELAHEEIVKQSQSVRKEAEELYESLKTVPWGFSLTSEEVSAAYAAGGVDYQTIVTSVSNRCQEKESISSHVLTDFQELKTQLKAGIDKKIQEDATLALEIAGWTEMIS